MIYSVRIIIQLERFARCSIMMGCDLCGHRHVHAACNYKHVLLDLDCALAHVSRSRAIALAGRKRPQLANDMWTILKVVPMTCRRRTAITISKPLDEVHIMDLFMFAASGAIH